MRTLDPASPAARDLATGRYVIRTMTAEDLVTVAIPWMAEAGWNPGLHDATTFREADPEGFHIGLLDGVPIATVSGVRYSDDFAFLGCYIVAEGHRGRGYGLAIHEAARRRLEGCVQGGDGVLENVPVYERIGRVLAYRNARFEGVRGSAAEATAAAASTPSPDPTVDARALPIEAIEAIDRLGFPAPRRAFLAAWLAQPDAFARAMPGDAGLRGYGVIRRCVHGWKVGPLFALDLADAETILDALLARIPGGDPWILDIPEPNAAARALVAGRAMAQVFATARMYTGPAPAIALEHVFGVTSFELG
jgi:RimJ/RimL family protein N-acetyltransferase